MNCRFCGTSMDELPCRTYSDSRPDVDYKWCAHCGTLLRWQDDLPLEKADWEQPDKRIMMLTNCHDCAAKPGEAHKPGCDTERCSVCGGQKLSCFCYGHDPQFARWSGFWPGKLEANVLGITLNDLYEQGLEKAFFVKPKSEQNESITFKQISVDDVKDGKRYLLKVKDNGYHTGVAVVMDDTYKFFNDSGTGDVVWGLSEIEAVYELSQ